MRWLDSVLVVGDKWRIALDIVQRNVGGLVDHLQPAFWCGIHQVAGHFGLAVNRDMLAGQAKRVDPDQPFTIGKRKALFEHPFRVQTGIDAQPVQQIGGCPLQHAGTNAAQHIIGRSALDDNAVDPLCTQQMAEQQSRWSSADYRDLCFHPNCCSRSCSTL